MSKVVATIEPNAPVQAQPETSALISMIERAARDPSVDIDKMERLFEMQQKAEAQRAKAAFLADFALLQSELPAATRNGTGHNQKKYARFEDVVAALRPHLASHGFSLSHRVKTDSNIIRVTGILGHRDGHTEETEMTLPPDTSGGKTPVHALGSAISYGKRYVSLTLTGIATEDDDDGKAAGAGAFITDDQQSSLRALVDDTASDMGQFLQFAGAHNMAEIPARDYPRLHGLLTVKALKKKAQKGAK